MARRVGNRLPGRFYGEDKEIKYTTTPTTNYFLWVEFVNGLFLWLVAARRKQNTPTYTQDSLKDFWRGSFDGLCLERLYIQYISPSGMQTAILLPFSDRKRQYHRGESLNHTGVFPNSCLMSRIRKNGDSFPSLNHILKHYKKGYKSATNIQ